MEFESPLFVLGVSFALSELTGGAFKGVADVSVVAWSSFRRFLGALLL